MKLCNAAHGRGLAQTVHQAAGECELRIRQGVDLAALHIARNFGSRFVTWCVLATGEMNRKRCTHHMLSHNAYVYVCARVCVYLCLALTVLTIFLSALSANVPNAANCNFLFKFVLQCSTLANPRSFSIFHFPLPSERSFSNCRCIYALHSL